MAVQLGHESAQLLGIKNVSLKQLSLSDCSVPCDAQRQASTVCSYWPPAARGCGVGGGENKDMGEGGNVAVDELQFWCGGGSVRIFIIQHILTSIEHCKTFIRHFNYIGFCIKRDKETAQHHHPGHRLIVIPLASVLWPVFAIGSNQASHARDLNFKPIYTTRLQCWLFTQHFNGTTLLPNMLYRDKKMFSMC